YIGGISHLASGSDIANHTVTELEACALGVQRTTVYGSHFELAPFFIVQVNIRFQAPERTCHVVDDLIDQLVKIKNGTDLLSPLLHFQQVFYLIGIKRTRVAD